ncbi:MAG: Cof-type HAD-IIB family hydrolase [Coprobacillus sp.]|nr:Cof-type HAD-IIB family hydrolase [Coprobacillus sp.]
MTNKKYLIVIDMDSTLLTDEKTISSASVKYLKSLQDEGHIVMLASGRPKRSLIYYYDQIGLNSPLICYNGAYCFHPSDENFKVTHFTFPKEIIKEIYTDCSDAISNVMCETDDKIWLGEPDEELSRFFWHDGLKINYGDIRETLDEDPWTMIMKDTDSARPDERIDEAVKKHKGYAVRYWFKAEYSEIYFKKISKAACIKRSAHYYHIPRKNVICIGDSFNDLEMIKYAGIGVTMINGVDKLKKAADIVTEYDNNNDGVMRVLKSILEK